MVPKTIEERIKKLFSEFCVDEEKIHNHGTTIEEIGRTAFPSGYNPPYKIDDLIRIRRDLKLPGNFLGNSARLSVSNEAFHKIKYANRPNKFDARRAYASDTFSMGKLLLVSKDPCAVYFFERSTDMCKEIYRNFCEKDAENAATVGRAYAQLAYSLIRINELDCYVLERARSNSQNSIIFTQKAICNLVGSKNQSKVDKILSDTAKTLLLAHEETVLKHGTIDYDFFSKNVAPIVDQFGRQQII